MAVTHVLELPHKLEEAPYMAVLFCGLILGGCVLALLLLAGWHERLVWITAGVLAALTIVGYALSRSIGLPQLEDHVGMWLDPRGIAAAGFELALVALALAHVRRGRDGGRSTAAVRI